ncbi:MAG: zinc ribbon domain-containing protein [Actinobacteria bacterium]|nr:zinc ribbon domain-containing protein [Actinomycetota bacterium]
MFCASCGNPVAPSSTFCGKCGTRVGGPATAPTAGGLPSPPGAMPPAPVWGDGGVPTSVEPVQKKNKTVPLMVGAAVLVIVVVAAGVGLFVLGGSNDNPHYASMDQIKAKFAGSGFECKDWFDLAKTTTYLAGAPQSQWMCDTTASDLQITIWPSSTANKVDIAELCQAGGTYVVMGDNWNVMSYAPFPGGGARIGRSDFPADKVKSALGGTRKNC